MKFLIIAFKSRNNLYSFNSMLRKYNVSTNIINTPRSVSISCGLSIKTDFRNLALVKTILSQSSLDGFMGCYLINRNLGYEQVERIM